MLEVEETCVAVILGTHVDAWLAEFCLDAGGDDASFADAVAFAFGRELLCIDGPLFLHERILSRFCSLSGSNDGILKLPALLHLLRISPVRV